MQPADYHGLGITRPEMREAAEPTNRRLERQDVEDALTGLPLRLESLISRGFDSETWLVRTTAEFCLVGREKALVAKLTTYAVEDSADFFGRSSSAAIPMILFPIYRQSLPANRVLLITPHLPLGSLRERMHGTRLGEEQIRSVARQIATALSHMSNMDANRVLVHGDIKPENILLKAVDPIDTLLADFDHSLWVPKEGTRRHGGMLSLRYSAPEGLGEDGLWSSNSDMWSLGILLLELLLGHHPFVGLSDESVRANLSGTWDGERPEEESLSDAWRALLLGLLDRNYAARWRPADVALWLEGDRKTIAKGLARGREKSANSPFEFNGQHIYTAHWLARKLVADWNAGIAALRSSELNVWLRDSLGSQELASRLQSLLEDASLADDDRLIRFAYFAHHELDPCWRDIRLSQAALHQLASRALEGSDAAYQQLVLLREATIVDSYSSLGIQGPHQLIGDWSAGWQRYQSGWQLLQEVGAPDSRPADEAAFPALVRLWLSPAERQALVERVLERCSAVRYLLRRNWYFALGHDLPALPIEHQWILDGLDRSSLVETLMYSGSHQDFVAGEFRQPPTVTDEQLMNAVLLSRTTDRLTRNLALDHRSREEVMLQGTQQQDQRLNPDAWDSFWTRATAPIGIRMTALVQRLRHWWGRRRQGINPETRLGVANGSREENAVNISAVRLSLTIPGLPNLSLGQAALMRWDLPTNARPVIHIGHLGLFGRRITRQRIVRLPFRLEGAPAPNALQRIARRNETVGLPSRGQIVFAFFQPTIVWLRFRMPGRRGRVQSQVLRLGARDVPLRPIAEKFRDAHATLLETAPIELLALTAPIDAPPIPSLIDIQLPPVITAPRMLQARTSDRQVNFFQCRPELQLPVGTYLRLHQHFFQCRPELQLPFGTYLKLHQQLMRRRRKGF
jgi:serine/threonine protein kinase